MISDLFVVVLTKQLSNQLKFYQGTLGLDLIYNNNGAIGLGKDGRVFIILRRDNSKDSHHLTVQKGPQIISFQCKGNANSYIDKIKKSGCTIRDILKLPEYKTLCLFIEDFDKNEICLAFNL
jgi:hypothetical protein